MDSELEASLSTAISTPVLCVGQCFSPCWWKQMFLQWAAQFGSARPLRGLLYRLLTFFYPCLKYLPDLVKTRALQKANVSLLPLHVFWQLKTNFCFLREPRLGCFFGENLNAKDPADASWARMDQGKSPIWARTSPSLRAPGFPLFFGLLSFSSPYPPTKKWK